MVVNLRLFLILLSIILVVIILRLVEKNKLPIKYSLFWFLSSLVVFLVGVFPDFIGIFTGLLGFENSSSLVVCIIIGLLLLITLLLTIIVSEQKRKLLLLIQEVSLLKQKMDQNKKE